VNRKDTRLKYFLCLLLLPTKIWQCSTTFGISSLHGTTCISELLIKNLSDEKWLEGFTSVLKSAHTDSIVASLTLKRQIEFISELLSIRKSLTPEFAKILD